VGHHRSTVWQSSDGGRTTWERWRRAHGSSGGRPESSVCVRERCRGARVVLLDKSITFVGHP
jgi:hypothetical protein